MRANSCFMKILVTGGAGKVGSAVARDLIEAGHSVRIFDQTAPAADLRAKCEIVYGDILDRFALLRACEGIEGIAHLAAIPDPMGRNAIELFAPNVLGTQLVLEAAQAHDIGRVALASSISIYGFAFQKSGDLIPDYLPVDVAHPLPIEDVYALSKLCNELTAQMVTRRNGMATTCLRLAWVVDLERPNRWMRRRIENAADFKDNGFWSYIDVRDAARAFRLALENVESGHHVLLVTARDLLSEIAPHELIARHFPALLPSLDGDFDFARYGFWDTRPATELLGWESQFHWREALDAQNEQT